MSVRAAKLKEPALAIIREFLSYDPESGLFICRKRYCNKVHVGDIVGSVNTNGYLELCFKRYRYSCHRLAWWWIHGVWPTEIDHRNLAKSDNRMFNLRESNRSRNVANARRKKSSGFKGVYPLRQSGRWIAKIKHNYKSIHIGVFDDEEEAARAYDAAALRYFGEFARPNFSVAFT